MSENSQNDNNFYISEDVLIEANQFSDSQQDNNPLESEPIIYPQNQSWQRRTHLFDTEFPNCLENQSVGDSC